MLYRMFVSLLMIGLFWGGLWIVGKVDAPNMERLGIVAEGARGVAVGAAQTTGQAVGGAVGAIETRGGQGNSEGGR